MAVETCCGEDPGVGSVGVMGFRFGEEAIFVESGPFEFVIATRSEPSPVSDTMFANSSKTRVAFFCAHSWHLLKLMGEKEIPAQAVADLRNALGC